MKKKGILEKCLIFIVLLCLLLLIIWGYSYINQKYGLGIQCTLNKLFKIYCPGCGLTRATEAILKLDFYQAFRYHTLSLVLMPMFLIICVLALFELVFYKKTVLCKIPDIFWCGLAVLLLIYGVIRNFIPYLQPCDIK